MIEKHSKFRPWVRKVMPTVYDDSLTYYELLSKVIGYMNQLNDQANEIIDFMDGAVNSQDESVKELEVAFVTLRDNLNNVYDKFKLDVERTLLPENIDHVLTNWYDNGKLADVINQEVFNMKVDKDTFNETIDIVNQEINSTNQSIENKAIRHRQIKAKICTNINFTAGVFDNIDSIYSFWKESGIEKVIFTLHLEGTDCTLKEDMSKIKIAIDKAKSLFTVNTLKIHCTVPELATSTITQTAYENSVMNILDDVGLSFLEVIVLNERADVHNNANNQAWCINLINKIKAKGFQCGVSFQGSNEVMESVQLYPSFMNVLDTIGLNCYPSISTRMKATNKSDSVYAWKQQENTLTFLRNKYQNKKVVISEAGILPYWEMLADPWIYIKTGKTLGNEQVNILFFDGLFEGGLPNVLDEIWFWFMEDPIIDTTIKQAFNHKYFATYITSKL